MPNIDKICPFDKKPCVYGKQCRQMDDSRFNYSYKVPDCPRAKISFMEA